MDDLMIGYIVTDNQIVYFVMGACLPGYSFTTKQLTIIYMKMLSLIFIIAAYIRNAEYSDYISNETNDGSISQQESSNHLTLLLLTTTFFLTGHMIPPLAIWTLFFLPPFIPSLSPSVIQLTTFLSVYGGCMLLVYSVWMHGFDVCDEVYNGLMRCHSILESYHIFAIFEMQKDSLHIPQVFRTYWVIKNVYDIMLGINESSNPLTVQDITKISLISSTENLVSLSGLISIISLTIHTFSYKVHVFLEHKQPFDKEIGQMAGTLLFLFCVQGNITFSDAETRYQQVSYYLLLLLIAILHFLYYEIKDELLSIGSANIPPLKKQIKTLLIALLPIIVSTMVLQYEFSTDNSITWLLCSSSLNAGILLKSTVTLVIFTLLMIDTYKCGLWENLDDFIYYIKFVMDITELLLGICLVLTNIYMLFFESAFIARITISIHLYFNVWIPFSRAEEEYKEHAASLDLIKDLRIATKEELKIKKDICGICFQNLYTARVTKCNHFFHGSCLRKWLHVQPPCPLCFKLINPKPEYMLPPTYH